MPSFPRRTFRFPSFFEQNRVCWAALSTLVFLVLMPIIPAAAQSEFPDDWYFSPEGGVRGKLEGKPGMPWSASTWIGESHDLQSCSGKVVVLDFWATWCGPCVASIPKNIDLVSQHPEDLVFIGMHSATSGWDKAPQMVEDRKINYPVALDSGSTGKAYQISAFPTYVIIDRTGVIRAAGVIPSRVGEIVKKLLGENSPSASVSMASSFSQEWFYRGANLMTSWQKQHGQPMSQIKASSWWDPNSRTDQPEKTEDAPTEETPSDPTAVTGVDETASTPDEMIEFSELEKIRVLHFTRIGHAIAGTHLKALNAAAIKYSPLGVGFAVICDHDSEWSESQKTAETLELKIPMALDDAVETTPAETTDETSASTSPREMGSTAKSYNIRAFPVTVLVDRQGRIRATGIKIEKLTAAIDQLLAEPAG